MSLGSKIKLKFMFNIEHPGLTLSFYEGGEYSSTGLKDNVFGAGYEFSSWKIEDGRLLYKHIPEHSWNLWGASERQVLKLISDYIAEQFLLKE